MRLAELEGTLLEEADEILDAASHDVAKYMAMTARNVDPEAIPEELSARLLEEVLRVDGRRPAWELWRTFSDRLRALSSEDEALEALDAAMSRIAEAALSEPVDHGALARVVAAAAHDIDALKRAVRRRRMEARSR